MLKSSLRKTAKEFRASLNITEKAKKDNLIFQKLIKLPEFLNSEIVLCYYSSEIEVDTIKIIEHSLKLNKKVALPKCIDQNGNMIFKYINSLDDVEIGSFGILEPFDKMINYNFSDYKAICIIPALMVDNDGHRLGYGKGYYDKFLSRFNGFKCVLCYKENLVDKLPVYEKIDVKCDLFLTD